MSIFLSTNTLAALQPAPEPPPTPSPQLGTGQTPSATGLMGAPDETGPVGMMGPVAPPPPPPPSDNGVFGGIGDALGGIGDYIGGQFQNNPFLNPLAGSTGPGQALTNTRQFLNTNPVSNAVGDPLVKFASDPRVQIASQAIFSPDILTPDMPVPFGVRPFGGADAPPEVPLPTAPVEAPQPNALRRALQFDPSTEAEITGEMQRQRIIDELGHIGLPDAQAADPEQARLQALLDAAKPADATVPAAGPAFRSDGSPITPENPLTPDESTVPSGYNADPALADQPFRSPEQIQHDIEAATAQSMGGHPGDINPAYATQALSPAQLPADAPPQQLLQAGLDQGASLWAQRQQAVSDLYKSQIARYQEAFERAGGGEAGDRAGRAAMSGNVADQPTFTPLQEVYSPQQIDSLYHSLDGLSGFTGTTARGAMRGMVERGIPPTPSQLEALSQVMPDLPAQLTRLGVYDLPPTSLAQNAKRGVLDFLNGIGRAPIQTLNNTGRTIETVGDVAAPGRLAPTAGAFMPKVYAESLGDLGKIEFAKDPKAVIANIWEGLRNDPDMQALGISPEDMFDKDTGFGMHGAGTDPYSGDLQPGGGVGLLKGSQRAQLLGNWMQVLRPQMLREHILNTIKGAGDETAQAAMKQRIMSDGAFRLDLGHSIDLVTGHSAWRPFGDESQLLVNFGNWFAAQGELIAKGAVGGAKGAANVIPGVNIPVSSTEAVARTALGRLAALGTMATVAINGINGVDPRDPRASRNGVPMVVITPALAKNLSNVPVIGRLLHFTPNTQQDIYGPIGEYIQHAAGVGIGAVKGTTSATGGIGNEALGAAKGAGGEAAYWGRGLLAWVPGVINNLFIAKDNFGQPNTLANNMPLPFNVSGFVGDAQRSTGTTIGSMLGGRFHEPSANAQLDAGTLDYWKMSADQQFKAVRHQSWLSLEDMFPADTKGFASYFDWYSATKDDFEKQLESQGLSPSAAQEKAQQFLQLHPIVKTYTDMHNQLEDQWGMDHPQEAAKLLNAEADVPWQDKTFRPTKQLQESLQAIPAGAK